MAKQVKTIVFRDDVEKIAKKLGLNQIANKIAQTSDEKDCGCGKRKADS